MEATAVASKTVLLVDDDPFQLDITSLFFKEKGFEVLQTTDPERAYELAEERHPDLIISDINMPGIDGLTLCKGFKNNRITNQIPLVFISGNKLATDLQEGFASGATLYFLKPIDWKDAWPQIQALLPTVQS